MLESVLSVIGIGSIVSIALTVLAKIIPNDKVYGFGVVVGKAISSFGNLRFGQAIYEKVEDFVLNSMLQFINGIKFGMEFDDALSATESNKVADPEIPKVEKAKLKARI